MQNFLEHLFWRASVNGCFLLCFKYFLGNFFKYSKSQHFKDILTKGWLWKSLRIYFTFAVFSQFTIQLLISFEPWKSWKYKHLWEPRPALCINVSWGSKYDSGPSESGIGVSLRISWNFQEHPFYTTPLDVSNTSVGYICMYLLLSQQIYFQTWQYFVTYKV